MTEPDHNVLLWGKCLEIAPDCRDRRVGFESFVAVEHHGKDVANETSALACAHGRIDPVAESAVNVVRRSLYGLQGRAFRQRAELRVLQVGPCSQYQACGQQQARQQNPKHPTNHHVSFKYHRRINAE